MTNNLLKLAESLTWQDISTAPKDREIIILTKDGDMEICSWANSPGDGVWKNPNGGWVTIGRALSWMPLPTGNAGEVIKCLVYALLEYQEIDDKLISFTRGFAATKDDIDINSIARITLTRANELAGEKDV
jgi:hypothetical protein